MCYFLYSRNYFIKAFKKVEAIASTFLLLTVKEERGKLNIYIREKEWQVEGVQTSSKRAWGLLLVIIGATMWGVSGTVAQYLFQHKSFNAEWLVVVRMLVSGLLLLAIASKQRNIFAIWKTKEERTSLLFIRFSLNAFLRNGAQLK
jgi:undecaprenyl pyrophosphate phosphatase UppP